MTDSCANSYRTWLAGMREAEKAADAQRAVELASLDWDANWRAYDDLIAVGLANRSQDPPTSGLIDFRRQLEAAAKVMGHIEPA